MQKIGNPTIRLPFIFSMLKISQIENKSIASKTGLKVDDQIVAFNGQTALDMLDVAYFDAQANFSVTVERNGKHFTFSVTKDEWEPMGWDFYEQCFVEPRWCANKCIFCFVDQLPKGMRKTMYVKDDDWRLSFASGNYVTLTNVTDAEVERICSKKFSPLYVSVHATDDTLRRQMLGNSTARPILPLLKKFAENGIQMHTQIVMVPGYNDDKVLMQSLADLYSLYPAVQSVAVVPVGLTKHRCNLANLKVVDSAVASKTINQVEDFAEMVYNKDGVRFAYCSDEMYVFAGKQVPDYTYYGDFAQIENGVGLIADFYYQWDLAYQDAQQPKKGTFTCLTGVSFAPYLQQTLDKAKQQFPTLAVNVLPVENKFFGETVTVAGLLVGQDLVNAVQACNNVGDTLILPRVMLREIEDVFLDGMTLDQFKKLTNKKVLVVCDGYESCQALLECE